ncbi:hypothetical protein RUND412_009997 [Rhizina undulata]
MTVGVVNDSPSGDKVLFSPEIAKTVLSNSRASTTFIKIGDGGLNTQMISCKWYILVSQEYHPDCPQCIGENGLLLEISGGEYFKEIDHKIIFPVFHRESKSLHYFGNYKLGEREIIPMHEFEALPEKLRDFWANKIKDSQWRHRLHVQAGLVGASEMRNLSLNEILGWFRLSSEEGSLRKSITRFIFDTFSSEINDTLLATAASFASLNQEEPKASIPSVGSHGGPSDIKRMRPRIKAKLVHYSSDEDYIPPRSQANGLTYSTRARRVLNIEKKKEIEEVEEEDGGEEEEEEIEEDENLEIPYLEP